MPDHKPDIPHVIDRHLVDTSLEPRPIGVTTDESRAATAAATEGLPLVEFSGTTNPYIDYQFVDILHSLQQPRSDAYDERCFIVMGQVKELLFSGLHFELHNARVLVDADRVAEAIVVLERAGAFVDYLTASWNVLETITAEGFAQFRDQLSTASGQQSFMYRHVEFVLGNKSRELAEAHRNVPHVWPAIERALNTPSLYDRVIAYLARSGHPIDDAALRRDWAEPYQANTSVEEAWFEVYRDPSPSNVAYRLAEALLALDEKFSTYRWRHFRSVEKTIGLKPGTGGSSGVGWLQHVTGHRFFPELWSLRNRL
jgi:tryptophan 2,3-dioxygenase